MLKMLNLRAFRYGEIEISIKSQKSFFKNFVFVILDSLLLLVVVNENNNYRKDIGLYIHIESERAEE